MKDSRPAGTAGEGNGLAESQAAFVNHPTRLRSTRPRRIVCIGASAGGLEPLELFFDAAPVDSGMAFVVVQHLSPDFNSLMDELLARHTTMPIHRVEDGMQVEGDAIYLIPPRKEMIVAKGQLRLQEISREKPWSLPIDTFMRSLAEDQGERAIGIVLSGTGSDGSKGARAINDAGGLVIVQDPKTARFDGMPASAIEAAGAVVVVPPSQMPGLLLRHLQGVDLHDAKLGALDSVLDAKGRILELLRRRLGADFGYYKSSTVERRIERRAQLMNIENLDAYARMLEQDPEELDALYGDLLIGVTAFFRDREAFDYLEREIVPQLAREMSAERPVRIWVPACATGEEAYSIAMMFLDHAMATGKIPNVKIFATDIHQTSLDRAAAGLYRVEALTGLDSARVERYFEQVGDHFQIAQKVRRLVVFSQHNLLKDPPFTRTNLVSCRNLLIYFGDVAQRKVLSLFHFSLRKDGILFLGTSETTGEIAHEFTPLSSRWRVFRKERDVRLPESTYLLPVAPAMPSNSFAARGDFPPPRQIGQRHLLPAYDKLLDRYAPPSMLVSQGGELLQVFGGARKYLEINDGFFSRRIGDLVRDELKMIVAGGIERAWRQGATVTTRFAPSSPAGEEGRSRPVNVTIEPLGGTDGRRADYLLITFAEQEAEAVQDPPAARAEPRPEMVVQTVAQDDALRGRLKDLERDLLFTEESLQSTIEELEASNEELQATNEELMASNEELQSTNEELHSVNEELYTVSAEHQRKIEELTQVTTDMDNLLRSTHIGTVFVDPRLRVRRYTPAVADIFNLMPHDVGRPIEHVTYCFHDDDLHGDLRLVIQGGPPVEREVRLEDKRTFLMRIMPYVDVADERAGAVLTFVDITELKHAQDEMRELQLELAKGRQVRAESERDRLFALLLQAPALISVHEGPDHIFAFSNPLHDAAIGYRKVLGRPVREAMPEFADQGVLERFDEVYRTGEPSVAHEIAINTGHDGQQERRYTQALQAYRDAEDKIVGVMSFAYDITAVVQARARAEQLSRSLEKVQERIELAFSVGRMGHATIDLDARAFSCSPQLGPMLGIGASREPVPLETFTDCIEPEDADRLLARLDMLRETGGDIDIEVTLKAGEQPCSFMRIVGSVFLEPAPSFSGLIADITETRRAEQLLEARNTQLSTANDQLEQFAYIVSHDLKSPMRGVRHLAAFLREDLGEEMDERASEHLARLDRQVARMSQMLDDLLAYSHLESGLVRQERVAVAAVIEDAAALIGLPEGFTLDLASDLPVIATNRSALALVFRNLMDNAVKHHDSEKAVITVTAKPAGEDYVAFSFADDGPGVAADRRPELEKLFSDLEPRGRIVGSGMGLIFVKRAVSRFGGKIRLATKEGERGTCIVFTWPTRLETT